MTKFRGVWDAAEVESFLREAKIPIRIATHRPDGSPWVVTLWFRYRNDTFECATAASAALVTFLRREPEVAFDVSTNEIPYRGIRGNGTATISSDENKVLLQSLLERYLGSTKSSLADRLLRDDRDEVRIRIDPAMIYSWDYSDRMDSPIRE